jgi:hypothetical protein
MERRTKRPRLRLIASLQEQIAKIGAEIDNLQKDKDFYLQIIEELSTGGSEESEEADED